jgi:small subunit ribosomal protein S8
MVRQGLGFAIVTTPQGVMTDYECRRSGVGGEVLALVW